MIQNRLAVNNTPETTNYDVLLKKYRVVGTEQLLQYLEYSHLLQLVLPLDGALVTCPDQVRHTERRRNLQLRVVVNLQAKTVVLIG